MTAETGSEPPPESGNHRGACLRGRAGSWKLIRRLGLRPADGALSRPDVAEGALSGATIAQRVEIALSGRDRADAPGDAAVLTPGIGRRGGRRAGNGLGCYVVLASFCGFWGPRGAEGEIRGYSTLSLCSKGLLYTAFL